MTPSFVIVIPARYQAQRLPGKALADIGGRPMIRWVWDCACASGAREVIVATDDGRIAEAVEGFGGNVVRTSADHASGSDRIAECARIRGWGDDQLIVNLQGDEPEMPPACLDQVARMLAEDPSCDVATLCWPIDEEEEIADPNAVKVVFGADGRALYFSRTPIPFARAHENPAAALAAGVRWYRHLGLYAYRNAALQDFTRRAPTPLEQAEHLEQLRFLESGVAIRVAMAAEPIPPGVDTPADLERARARLGQRAPGD